MKEIKEKINLFKLQDEQLLDSKGGMQNTCACGCFYADCGGSSSSANSNANFLGSKYSPPGSGC